MDWHAITDKYHTQTLPPDYQLSSLREEWQRELAALWRLESEVNSGAYLQFLAWWGLESYAYASQALKKIGAHKMAVIVDRCQALVDEHFDSEGASREDFGKLMPNPAIIRDGQSIESDGSILPDSVLNRIYELSYEFMSYPEDIAQLGWDYYRLKIQGDGSG